MITNGGYAGFFNSFSPASGVSRIFVAMGSFDPDEIFRLNIMICDELDGKESCEEARLR